ncbi:MrpF/PhaF family protein [Streptomyces sp. NPDC005322]|uniref:MrpF/PhaF family protein n=1 Tax=Streptomyces sp. NPDC005322 TaxID=3157032 RepID=UPI0033BFB331
MSASDGWLLAALVPLLALAPVLWWIARGEPGDRLIAQNLTSLLAGLTVLPAAQGLGRPSYVDVALVLAVLGPTGTLIYARFLGVLPDSRLVRWTALVGVPATVLPLCVATGPGRAMLKLLLIGALLIAGSVVTSTGGSRPASGNGGAAK